MARMIGVNSNCYHGYSIEDALEGIAKAGFHYVELTATKGWTEHVFPDQSFERLVEVKNIMKELDLHPDCIDRASYNYIYAYKFI